MAVLGPGLRPPASRSGHLHRVRLVALAGGVPVITHARTYAATAAIATPDCLPVTIAAVRARLLAAHLVRLGPVRVDVFLGEELRDAEAAVAEFGLGDSPLVALFRACPGDVVLVVGAVQVPNQHDRWN